MNKVEKDIIEALTSHPSKMLSKKELKHILPKHDNKKIIDKIKSLKNKNLITVYKFKNLNNSKYPIRYIGFTINGLEKRDEKSIKKSKRKYKNNITSEQIQEFWEASRPEYPDKIKEKFENNKDKKDIEDYKNLKDVRQRESWYQNGYPD